MDFITLLDKWAKRKVFLWKKEPKALFREGEIWWCSVGMNVGEETLGKGKKFGRPVLVFRKLSHNIFLGLPLTTTVKEGTWYVEIDLHDGIRRFVMLHQARMFDRRRLLKRMSVLGESQRASVSNGFSNLYCP